MEHIGNVFNITSKNDYCKVQTHRVIGMRTGTHPVITQQLFAVSPNYRTNELLSSEIYWTLTSFELADKVPTTNIIKYSDWGVNLEQAIDDGLISLISVERMFKNQSKSFIRTSPVIWVSSKASCCAVIQLPTLDSTPTYPKSLVFKWQSQQQMKNDVKKVFPAAYFM